MVYKEFQNINSSALGIGEEQGINNYDTAFGYHNGQLEIVIGKVLDKYPREIYYFATKLRRTI